MNESDAQDLLSVPIPLTPHYTSRYVNIRQTGITINIPLINGSHVITTDLIEVGTLPHFKDPVLQASMTFWYKYDASRKVLTFCSNDLVSDNAPYVTTVPRGSSQYCREHAYLVDNLACDNNPNWNYRTPLTPGLQAALQEIVRNANFAIIQKAESSGFTVIVRTPPPQITEEDNEKLSAVYYKGKFLEFYDPSKTYDNDHSIHNFQSVWYGTTTLAEDQHFANVIGSTDDPIPMGSSWISLWKSQFGQLRCCASLRIPASVNCSDRLIGGHVILGERACHVDKGSDEVHIIPICVPHNNNDNVTMMARYERHAITLQGYLNDPEPPGG